MPAIDNKHNCGVKHGQPASVFLIITNTKVFCEWCACAYRCGLGTPNNVNNNKPPLVRAYKVSCGQHIGIRERVEEKERYDRLNDIPAEMNSSRLTSKAAFPRMI